MTSSEVLGHLLHYAKSEEKGYAPDMNEFADQIEHDLDQLEIIKDKLINEFIKLQEILTGKIKEDYYNPNCETCKLVFMGRRDEIKDLIIVLGLWDLVKNWGDKTNESKTI